MPITRMLVLAAAAICAGGASAGPRSEPGSALAPAGADSAVRDSALHLLNRITFGPRPGDVERVVHMGIAEYVDEQLHPERIPDPVADRAMRRLDVLHRSTTDLARAYLADLRARRQRLAAGDTTRPRGPNATRRAIGELQEAAVQRDVLSERQLYEVMVDFWANHFNVYAAKGADRFLIPDYIEHTIRPNALGRFEDLLIATAESPAMLFYLDNAESVADGATRPGRRFPRPAASGAAGAARRQATGINENYGRELMELHTLGVNGGYSQQDVIAVARILTGWSISRKGGDVAFTFNDWAHDRGEKVVLGRTFPAGHGMDEGVALLKFLANQPATMRHVSDELCARFVNDDPPDGCVDVAVEAWKRTGGDMRAVVRAILTSPDFWAASNANVKFKTPLRFVVSAVRAVGGQPDTTLKLAQVVARLGEPLYLQVAPTGYPEREDSWLTSGALLDRFNVALALAMGRMPGVTVDVGRILPRMADPDSLIAAVDRVVLHGTARPSTLDVMRQQLSQGVPGGDGRRLLVGLALGGPEFQTF